jgi:hypothetical protein
MRTLAITALAALLLGACAGEAGPAGDVANYDSLRQATAECAAKGGHLVLQKNGDPEYLGDYGCERK